ncbi:hypothetical protein V8G54_021832 [Vigna mungo]|uniref:Uncharacterized protein n=1 Tax=Vigna mungo TaxID=3915 RepID=A0AAQ3NEW2_VIGMU
MSDQEEGDLHLDKLKILTSKESKTENTQYYFVSWPDKKTVQVTNFPHPYPQLASLQKEMVRYQRKDGVQLTATLYLPPGYNPSTDGPLPCLVWSYPGEFKSKDAAGQVRGSPNEFPGIGSTSALLWLARRYWLSLPTMGFIWVFLFSIILLDFSVPNSIYVFVNYKMNLSLNTLNTAGLQFYLGLPFLLLVKVMKRQMIGNLIMILLQLWDLYHLLITNSCSAHEFQSHFLFKLDFQIFGPMRLWLRLFFSSACSNFAVKYPITSKALEFI